MPSDLTRSSLDLNKCFYSWHDVDTGDFLTLYVQALWSIETSGTIHEATQPKTCMFWRHADAL